MSEHPPGRIWSGIDIVKILAGTLAAVSAAVVGSFLGVAGTLIGAALASLVGGIGQEVYARSLHHGVSRLRGQPLRPPVTAPAAMGTPAVMASSEDETPGHFDPVPQDAATTRRPRWRLIAIPAVAVFVLAMGAVSAIEGVAGETFASMFGNETASRSTVGAIFDGGSKPTPKPSTTPTSGTTPAPDGKAPTNGPTGDAPPTGGAAPTAGQVSPEPPGTTAAPTADSGEQQQSTPKDQTDGAAGESGR